MKWIKHKVEDVDKFAADYIQVIRKGEAKLEHMYCVFKLIDNTIPQVFSLFDFIDYYTQRKITKENILNLYTYQPFN